MNIERLSPLLGLWKGTGNASFPTIASTNYIEEIEFSRMEKNHVLLYHQRTWYLEGPSQGLPLHWESGFIKILDDGMYQLSNTQDNGRVEVLKGEIEENDATLFHVTFESKLFGNDERMVKTARDYIISGNTLRYIFKMETKRTPNFQNHLEATLFKA